jgi:hypothetical protein
MVVKTQHPKSVAAERRTKLAKVVYDWNHAINSGATDGDMAELDIALEAVLIETGTIRPEDAIIEIRTDHVTGIIVLLEHTAIGVDKDGNTTEGGY